ncbi:MAG: aminoglycoside phosphotransferase family protein [Bacteroidetes bacterium]|nr:aminoglycoside phosphotransferase family protein [Bacteroidota bacterium]
MNNNIILKAAAQFLTVQDAITVEQLGNGLINHTYKASDGKKTIVLQAINTTVFKHPEDIATNYLQIFGHLQKNNSLIKIPPPIVSSNGNLIWRDEANRAWRATLFVSGSYSPMLAADEKAAYTVAKSFASFTHALATIDIHSLKEIIPNFHNLSFRYHQFEKAVAHASQDRLLKSTHIIAELRQRKKLADFFDAILHHPQYPTRVMHHDCKISNILFDQKTNTVICPIDLDTVMPGKYFSDLGDMIRSMTCTEDENSIEWEKIDTRPDFYKAIIKGYLDGIGDILTEEEKKNIHYSGLILIYMQSIRFIADFLNGDIYYKTNYKEQNLNRALNQLLLLERLEKFLEQEYSFNPYAKTYSAI